MERLVSDTLERRLALVHGDYSPKNVLVREGRLVLLDHEVIHFGDPAFDVGFALAHLLSKAHHLAGHRAALLKGTEIFWDSYRGEVAGAAWAGEVERFVVRHAAGCLLARVVGRSKLEYLMAGERERQRGAAAGLLNDPPASVRELAAEFLRSVGDGAH